MKKISDSKRKTLEDNSRKQNEEDEKEDEEGDENTNSKVEEKEKRNNNRDNTKRLSYPTGKSRDIDEYKVIDLKFLNNKLIPITLH